MDNVVDELIRIARKCERAFAPFEDGPVHDMNNRLLNACGEIGLSWSGSNIGYHASVYLEGFRKPKPGELFDREWGLSDSYHKQSSLYWTITNYDNVKNAIMGRANVSDLEPIENAGKRAFTTFEEAKGELLPTLDALLSGNDDAAIRQQKDKLAALPSCFTLEELVRGTLPRQMMSRDSMAMGQGVQPALHLMLHAWLSEQFSYGRQAGELAKIARYTARYLEQRMNMKGKTIAKTDGKIFIGHGRAADWRDLKDFIKDRLHLDHDEFNREPVAGLTAKERLLAMLDNASFAFLVMTAEDEHADGKQHARENVIHEIGLFQGRLGFERAIILLEEGCEEFSNILGIQQIRFAKGKLKGCFEEVRQVLEREGIVK